MDASEEPGFPFLGLALALYGSNRLSPPVRRPVRRRELPVPPLLGNRRDHSKGDVVLASAATNTFGVFHCAWSQLPSCYPAHAFRLQAKDAIRLNGHSTWRCATAGSWWPAAPVGPGPGVISSALSIRFRRGRVLIPFASILPGSGGGRRGRRNGPRR